jgi:hypothetical protein
MRRATFKKPGVDPGEREAAAEMELLRATFGDGGGSIGLRQTNA